MWFSNNNMCTSERQLLETMAEVYVYFLSL